MKNKYKLERSDNETEAERVSNDEIQKYLDVVANITCEYCGIRQGDVPNIPFHKDHIVVTKRKSL